MDLTANVRKVSNYTIKYTLQDNHANLQGHAKALFQSQRKDGQGMAKFFKVQLKDHMAAQARGVQTRSIPCNIFADSLTGKEILADWDDGKIPTEGDNACIDPLPMRGSHHPVKHVIPMLIKGKDANGQDTVFKMSTTYIFVMEGDSELDAIEKETVLMRTRVLDPNDTDVMPDMDKLAALQAGGEGDIEALLAGGGTPQ